MKPLPTQIYLSAQVRELDRLAIEEQEIPGYTLMYRAGQAAFEALRKRWPAAQRIVVLCGAGNNAGDGYIIARMARTYGMHVSVVSLFDPERLEGDAALAYATYREAGGGTNDWSLELLDEADVIVDSILGTGLTRSLEGAALRVVAAINESGVPVLAVDVPTGLNADTGRIMGASVSAKLTVTFVGLKLGLYLGAGPAHCGEIVFEDLGIRPSLYLSVPHAAQRIDPSLLRRVLAPRARDAHKGRFGHVLVVGGGPGMPGAARLTGEAALRSGAGKVTVATWPDNVAAVTSGRPELMCRGVAEPGDLASLLKRCDVIALGPGLGTNRWAQGLMRVVEASGKPVVCDADGLNLAAVASQQRDNWIYTPHAGEAATMLGRTPSQVQDDRSRAVADLVNAYGGIVVLKGAGTLVARHGEVPWVCDRGNPGMAAAGMGDVLTGVIAGVAAQCGDLFDAARVGVLAHAMAGDLVAADGERGMLAGEVCDQLRSVVN